jgi:hypothetical protein
MDELPTIAKDTSTRFHPELDFDRWREQFRWLYSFHYESAESFPAETRDEFEDEGRQSLDRGLAMVDRIETRTQPREGHAPTDIIVYDSIEEPSDRSMSKVGGVPYWPADRPWPTDWRGKPLRFMAQINFTDSRDIIGELPGDVLVLFEGFWRNHQEWFSAGLTNLIDPNDVPKQRDPYLPWHGPVTRIYDPPSTTSRPLRSPLCEATDNCIKIGGRPWTKKMRWPRDGQFLFQIHGLDQTIKEWEEEETDCENGACGTDCIMLEATFRYCPPVSGFLMPGGQVRLRWDRSQPEFEGDADNKRLHMSVAITDRDTGEGPSYDLNLRWPFVHRS